MQSVSLKAYKSTMRLPYMSLCKHIKLKDSSGIYLCFSELCRGWESTDRRCLLATGELPARTTRRARHGNLVGFFKIFTVHRSKVSADNFLAGRNNLWPPSSLAVAVQVETRSSWQCKPREPHRSKKKISLDPSWSADLKWVTWLEDK